MSTKNRILHLKARILPALVTLLLALTVLPNTLLAQSDDSTKRGVTGEVFLSGGGASNFEASTSDLFLHFGAGVGLPLQQKLDLIAGIGFVANVGDNDAFTDRSALFTPGLRYFFKHQNRQEIYVNGGYALSKGEGNTHHLGYFGAGLTHWYGDLIGLRFEVRDYLNGDLNLLEGRLSVVLR